MQRESLGDSVHLGEGYETYWSYVPHFIGMPFYVYAYAFGDCLVNSLYAVYENADSGFQDRYMEMLRAGGTKHHSELLAPFGLDARDPDFWQMGLSVIERMIDEIENRPMPPPGHADERNRPRPLRAGHIRKPAARHRSQPFLPPDAPLCPGEHGRERDRRASGRQCACSGMVSTGTRTRNSLRRRLAG